MPRLHGVRERRHQPVWDTLVRSTGAPSNPVAQQSFLFGNANVGSLALTNLQVAGQLASDQTYVILAMRAWLFFDGVNARTLYQGVTSQLYFTLQLGDKPQFSAPSWYFPAGGGVHGFDSSVNPIFNNGLPGQSEILKLARPIIIPVRQNIQVNAQFFPIGPTNVLDTINTSQADQMVVMYMLDGLQTRDVQ